MQSCATPCAKTSRNCNAIWVLQSSYVTHDQTEAMSMADTVVLMKDGHIQQVGAPEDLYSRPNNTFVAEFVGAPADGFVAVVCFGRVWR